MWKIRLPLQKTKIPNSRLFHGCPSPFNIQNILFLMLQQTNNIPKKLEGVEVSFLRWRSSGLGFRYSGFQFNDTPWFLLTFVCGIEKSDNADVLFFLHSLLGFLKFWKLLVSIPLSYADSQFFPALFLYIHIP